VDAVLMDISSFVSNFLCFLCLWCLCFNFFGFLADGSASTISDNNYFPSVSFWNVNARNNQQDASSLIRISDRINTNYKRITQVIPNVILWQKLHIRRPLNEWLIHPHILPYCC